MTRNKMFLCNLVEVALWYKNAGMTITQLRTELKIEGQSVTTITECLRHS
ncbi:MAG: hypothetical protein ACRC10_10415 [Thermoguttaceae bacterium]